MGALAWKLPDPAEVERRHDQRVEVCLLGRFMRSDRQEFDCESIDASPNGVAFSSDAGVQHGERIVAYLNRSDGSRDGSRESSRRLCNPDERAAHQARQAGQPTGVAREAPGAWLPQDRRHERIAPRDRYTILQLPNGREYTATLIDISMSGAALNVDCEPPIGARVIVGATPAEVVRHVNCGIAVEFLSPLPAEEFGESTTI